MCHIETAPFPELMSVVNFLLYISLIEIFFSYNAFEFGSNKAALKGSLAISHYISLCCWCKCLKSVLLSYSVSWVIKFLDYQRTVTAYKSLVNKRFSYVSAEQGSVFGSSVL